jgi:hypothetical protein
MEATSTLNARSNALRFRVIASSFCSLASTSTHVTMRRGRHPRSSDTRRATRSYQPTCRSRAPRSSIVVLISMTRSVPVRGSKASRSIQPRQRPSTIATSRAVSHPAPRSRRSTYPEQRACTASRWRRSPTITGERRVRSSSRPSARARRMITSSEGLAWPRSMPAMYDLATPTLAATADCVSPRACRPSRHARASVTRGTGRSKESKGIRRVNHRPLAWHLSGCRSPSETPERCMSTAHTRFGGMSLSPMRVDPQTVTQGDAGTGRASSPGLRREPANGTLRTWATSCWSG